MANVKTEAETNPEIRSRLEGMNDNTKRQLNGSPLGDELHDSDSEEEEGSEDEEENSDIDNIAQEE
ncbi:hypothetical protein ACHAPO_007351 [Fusarium lateritium]